MFSLPGDTPVTDTEHRRRTCQHSDFQHRRVLRRCCFRIHVRQRQIDLDGIVPDCRFRRPAGALELERMEHLELFEVSMDLSDVTIDDSRGLADALGLVLCAYWSEYFTPSW